MVIQNLLPFVAKSCRSGNISEFAGCSVAIDVSCLLHRGLFGCMEDRAAGKDNRAYIYYVKKYVDALVALNCHVIMVFDGRPLPAKKDTNAERSAKRKENMRQGEILLSQGHVEEAGSLFRQSTSITREVVETTIQHFRKSNLVDIIVAPYESDAQLAFLTREKLADVVVTEDSDLIAFGCEKIIFKWDVTGPCTIYERDKLPACFSGKMASEFDFTTFRRICILSGCDYLQGLKGVGLSQALQFFLKTSKTDLREILPRVPAYLRMPKLMVTDEFIEDFIRAEKTFLHQVVFDPRDRSQRPLTAYPLEVRPVKKGSQATIPFFDDDDDDFVPRLGVANAAAKNGDSDYSFAGTLVASSQAIRLALGNNSQGSSQEDPFHLPREIPDWSVWSSHYETRSQRLTRERAEEKADKDKKLRMGTVRKSVVDANDEPPFKKAAVEVGSECDCEEKQKQITSLKEELKEAQLRAAFLSVQREQERMKFEDVLSELWKERGRSEALEQILAREMAAVEVKKQRKKDDESPTSFATGSLGSQSQEPSDADEQQPPSPTVAAASPVAAASSAALDALANEINGDRQKTKDGHLAHLQSREERKRLALQAIIEKEENSAKSEKKGRRGRPPGSGSAVTTSVGPPKEEKREKGESRVLSSGRRKRKTDMEDEAARVDAVTAASPTPLLFPPRKKF